MSNQQQKEPQQKSISLGCFLEENQRLISTLGVFVALTVLSRNLPSPIIGYMLMCLFLAMSILIWAEVFSRFPDKNASGRLKWFENLLSFAMLGMAVYWLFEFSILLFNEVLVWVVFLVVAQIFLFCWSLATKRFDLFRRVFKAGPGERRRLRLAIGLLSIAFFAIAALIIAVAVTPKVKTFLAEGRRAILEATPTDLLGTNKTSSSHK